MNRLIAKTGIFVMFITFLSIGLFWCRKESPTIAIITVVDNTGTVAPNAHVRLYPTTTNSLPKEIIIDDIILTNENGKSKFDYSDMFKICQAGFAVLNIEVSLGDGLFGSGIIKVEAEKTSEEKIILLP